MVAIIDQNKEEGNPADPLRVDTTIWYSVAMNLLINPRGNGACPLCAMNGSCRVQRKLAENVDPLGMTHDDDMEIVVYSCPYFKEKNIS